MPNYSHITQIGHLTRDPEQTFTPAGLAITKFAIATNNGYGEKKDVCYVGITLFGKSAEAAAKYLSKGSAVLVDGRLSMSSWEDKNTGQKRTKHEIIGNSWHFVGERKAGEDREPVCDDEMPF